VPDGSAAGGSCAGNMAPCSPDQCAATESCRIAPGADLESATARCRPRCDAVCPFGGTCTYPDATSATGFRCTLPAPSGAVCDPSVTADSCMEEGTACVALNANDLTVGGWCDNPNGPVCMKVLQNLFFDDFCPQCEEFELKICECSTGPAHFQCVARWAGVRELHVAPNTRFERRTCRLNLENFDCSTYARPTSDFFQSPPYSLCGSESECFGGRCIVLNPFAVDPADTQVCSNDCMGHDDCPANLFTQFVCGEHPVDRDGNALPPACVPIDAAITGHDLGDACNPNTALGCEPFTCYRRPDDLMTGNPTGLCSISCNGSGDPVCTPNSMFCSASPLFPERGPFCDKIIDFGLPCAQYAAEADAACGAPDFSRRCADRPPDPETGEARTMCSVDCDPTGVACPSGSFCRTDDGTGSLAAPYCDLFVERFARCDAGDPAPSSGCESPNICAERPSAAGEFICAPSCDPLGPNTCPGGSTCDTNPAMVSICDPN
jgi:hypothetical protein